VFHASNRRTYEPANRRTYEPANRRTYEPANRRTDRRAGQSVRVALAASATEEGPAPWLVHLLRWMLGLLLLPFCVVTTWTLFEQFKDVTLHAHFWSTAAFWYFATGALWMGGWFFTRLFRPWFLHAYVVGHEWTHIVFIWCFFGKVKTWKASPEGGHVITNKSNIVIALAPYFVPLWSTVAMLLYLVLRHTMHLPPVAEKVLYFVVGFTWTFHLLWTLWMIPRDQPDLRENGTFLSLVIIYLVNLLVLVGLLCLASDHMSWRGFAVAWTIHASEGIRWTCEGLRDLLVWLHSSPPPGAAPRP